MKGAKVVLLVFVAAVLAFLGYGVMMIRRGFSARKQPSAFEVTLARAVRGISVPGEAKKEQNPWAGRVTPEILGAARAHWADHCANCHANDGSGRTEMGQNLYPRAPDMRLAATQNLSDGEL